MNLERYAVERANDENVMIATQTVGWRWDKLPDAVRCVYMDTEGPHIYRTVVTGNGWGCEQLREAVIAAVRKLRLTTRIGLMGKVTLFCIHDPVDAEQAAEIDRQENKRASLWYRGFCAKTGGRRVAALCELADLLEIDAARKH